MRKVVENLISNKNGKIIFLDEVAKVVIWQKEEYVIVSRIFDNKEGDIFLQSSTSFKDIDSAMLNFLMVKGNKLSIKVDLSEEDLSGLNNGETFDWTFKDEKSSLEVDIHLFNSAYGEYEDEEEAV